MRDVNGAFQWGKGTGQEAYPTKLPPPAQNTAAPTPAWQSPPCASTSALRTRSPATSAHAQNSAVPRRNPDRLDGLLIQHRGVFRLAPLLADQTGIVQQLRTALAGIQQLPVYFESLIVVLVVERQSGQTAQRFFGIGAELPWASLDAAVQNTAETAACESVAVAAFASMAAYRGDVALGGDFPRMLDALLTTGKPVALVALGNPT